MTFKKSVSKYLPPIKKLSQDQKGRLKAFEEIDEMRKINKNLSFQFYRKETHPE